ncbi:dTDP-4-dehydrorhamnose reductase [Motiliproteus sp. SC1-56]|uniref:dTDP-4-dehydrorhamnose reductase n=1 Tax=Motiliproteus sp. SC1-56 TaxID=2799565 RepID=UPI001A90B3D3|nr:dTDP-4-dehydrorhamnose reductase [Motiliproteus sp. SC1-56]
MKIVVTGANGQLGRCLQDRLNQRIDRGNRLEYVALTRGELDIANAGDVRGMVAKYKPDVVINAAAYTAVDKAEQESDEAYRINANGPANLAEACAQHDALLIHVSTDYVFDGIASEAYNEETPTNPLGVYGASKLDGEHRIQELCPRHVIVRAAWVFSEYGNNFLKTMLRLGAARESLSVVADQHGTPTYAGDLADTLLDIASSAIATNSHGVFHYCGGDATTWYGFAQTIFERSNALGLLTPVPSVDPISTEQFPTPAQRPAYSVLSGSKLKTSYGVDDGNWAFGVDHVLNRLSSKG